MASALLALVLSGTPQAQQVPLGEFPGTVVRSVEDGGGEVYVDAPLAGSYQQATGIQFDTNGRLYVWQKAGLVWVVEDGVQAPAPLIDIQDEVGHWNSHGLMGFATDPEFYSNGFVYLFYVVDYHHLANFGTPDYDPEADEYSRASIARITRYAVHDPLDPHTTVDPASRTILVGESSTTGFPVCSNSHGAGTLTFGNDGSLLASFGDSESGTTYETCITDGILRPAEDVHYFRSQLIDTLAGKIIRIDPRNGSGVSNNPFFDPLEPRAARSRVWQLGLRQPFRFGVGAPDEDPFLPGTLYIGDVGAQNSEELNVAPTGGLNFGWPFYEGHEFDSFHGNDVFDNLDAPNPLFRQDVPGVGVCVQEHFIFQDLFQEDSLLPEAATNPCDPALPIDPELTHVHTRPVISWSHESEAFVSAYDVNGAAATLPIDDPESSVVGEPFGGFCSIGGVWYDGNNFPERFRGSYIQSDFGLGWLKAFYFDEEHRLTEVVTFASTAGSPAAFALHPLDGELYYLDYYGGISGGGIVRKISFPVDVPAVAVAEAWPTGGATPLVVQFRGTQSKDPAGGPLSYRWDFGDGSPPSLSPNPVHLFDNAGGAPLTRKATLTVTAQSGLTAVDEIAIALDNTPPTATILAPAAGFEYEPGAFTNVTMAGFATDAESAPGQLECSWQVIEHHSDYSHYGPLDHDCGTTAFLNPQPSDEGDALYYELRLTVTDPAGLSTQASRMVGPTNDCNLNGYPDADEILMGLAEDFNANQIPDECELDCNANGVGDAFELATESSSDCNANGIPDTCDLVEGTAHDFDADGTLDTCQGVSPDTDAISLADGGTQTHSIDLGQDYAGHTYWLVGSLSGTFPGLAIGQVLIPLNGPDPYFNLSLLKANQPPFFGTVGFLDGNGRGVAAIALPPGLSASLAGLAVHHSAMIALPGATGLGQLVDSLDPMPLHLLP